MKRRAFLQRAGLIMTALGLTEPGLWLVGDRYRQALAAPTQRKLALLVGINQYTCSGKDCKPLQGCLTDVELQRELLIYRFGFQPADVLVLTEENATRQGIVDAFVNHLTAQAKSGDVVVVHFSGYSRWVNFTPENEAAIQSCLVPIDGVSAEPENFRGLTEETLLLLLRSLATDSVTTILDTSYTLRPEGTLLGLDSSSALKTIGNRDHNAPFLRRRDALETVLGPSSNELAFQAQLRDHLALSKPKMAIGKLPSKQVPGIVLTATHFPDREPLALPQAAAYEVRWSGFSAGLFTYALTQQLWSIMPKTTMQVSVSHAIGTIEQTLGDAQHPAVVGQKSKDPLPFAKQLPPSVLPVANGVVTSVDSDGKSGKVWLAGLPPMILDCYGTNSLLTVIPPEPGEASHRIQLYARDGLTARVRLVKDEVASVEATVPPGQPPDPLSGLAVGQSVQELVRILPRDLNLEVALDPGLQRIERVDATSALAGVPHVKAATGDQSVDCLFGKVLPEDRYGLLSIGQDLLPNTLGDPGEAIKQAISRVTPQLNSLLAAKLFRLTANEHSSSLAVRVALELVKPEESVLACRETLGIRYLGLLPLSGLSSSMMTDIPSIPVGSRVRYRVHNAGDRSLYLLLLGMNSAGRTIAFYAGQSESETSTAKPALTHSVIAPGEIVVVPQPSKAFEWVVQEPKGLEEIHVILSTMPFTKTIADLQANGRATGNSQRIDSPSNGVTVARSLLSDLHQASLRLEPKVNPSDDVLALNMKAWATFSFLYHVV